MPDQGPLLRLATRGSQLALWQAHAAARQLGAAGFATELLPFTTKGDQVLDRSLDKIGSKGVFTEELEQSLHEGQTHLAVHSAKDLPSTLPPGLEIVAFMEREQVNDVVLSLNPDFRLEGRQAVIGTSSTRRKALLQRHYPHLLAADVRGNLQTRLQKLKDGKYDALLLAYAGVHRMKFDEYISTIIPADLFVPAVGQGSVAIECAENMPAELKAQVKAALNHEPTAICLRAERAFLRTLEGGCSIPVFGYAQLVNGQVHLKGGIISLDGRELVEDAVTVAPEDAEQAGQQLGQRILDLGGGEILRAIRQKA